VPRQSRRSYARSRTRESPAGRSPHISMLHFAAGRPAGTGPRESPPIPGVVVDYKPMLHANVPPAGRPGLAKVTPQSQVPRPRHPPILLLACTAGARRPARAAKRTDIDVWRWVVPRDVRAFELLAVLEPHELSYYMCRDCQGSTSRVARLVTPPRAHTQKQAGRALAAMGPHSARGGDVMYPFTTLPG